MSVRKYSFSTFVWDRFYIETARLEKNVRSNPNGYQKLSYVLEDVVDCETSIPGACCRGLQHCLQQSARLYGVDNAPLVAD